MKVIAVGFTEMSGTSKKTGNDYHMARLVVLTETEDAKTESMTKSSYGYQAMEMDVDVKSHHRFDTLSYPCHVELVIDHRPRGGKVEAILSGFTGTPVPVTLSPVAKAA